ncbi:solute carrier family 35 member E1 homolog [Pectinophora gossypiella]|uniref:solute carrier family 35 member E1 homolog n=1 Tax=Pectinophora gossypiella TaxID=13191 RepID=UPI00214EF8E6|nr:solute carrier family 35 member E1 homolog [Pectinophora gossypiella]
MRCGWPLGRVRRETLTVAALCGAWYVLSSASNVVGKLALGEFPFPLTVAMVQLTAASALTGPALALCGVRAPAPRLRPLLPLAAAKFLTTLCSQVSIWKVPVSYAHTVKATTPLWTAGLAFVLWGERVPPRVGAALVLIAAGVGVASATELHFHALGLGAALAAAALLSLQHLYSKRVLRDTGVHHLRLLQALSALAAALFAPLWAWQDGAALLGGAGLGDRWRYAAALLAADGVLAWLQAVAAFSVLSRVTPLAYGVASAAKRAAVVAASLLVLRNPAPPLNVAGMALAAAGVLVYNRAKAGPQRRDAARRPLLPV